MKFSLVELERSSFKQTLFHAYRAADAGVTPYTHPIYGKVLKALQVDEGVTRKTTRTEIIVPTISDLSVKKLLLPVRPFLLE